MTFKIGVLYVGASQSTEEQVLSNTYGSPRYIKVRKQGFVLRSKELTTCGTFFFQFLERLGALKRLKDTDLYTGGLDRRDDADGEYSVIWHNDVLQVREADKR